MCPGELSGLMLHTTTAVTERGDMEPTSEKDTVEKEEVGASGEVKRDLLQDSTDPQLLSPPAEFPETCHLL